jgi:galactose mutarotase-like enzyme
MPARTWTLIDEHHNAIRDRQPLRIGPEDLGTSGGWSVTGLAWQDGLRAGVDGVALDNGRLAIVVLPTRGMGIHRAHLAGCPELSPIGWRSPVRGPVHPALVDLGEPSGLGWLDGFDELLVRCGLESNGAPEHDPQSGRLRYPLHGRIANRPAYAVTLSVDTDRGELALKGVVEETRFHFLKLRMTSTIRTRFGSAAFEVQDEVENLSGSPATMQLLYHVNFGLPLLDAGARVVAPAQRVVPRNARAAEGITTWDSFAAPEPGFEEMVYFLSLFAGPDGQTRVMLKNAHATRGVSLSWPVASLPWFTLWKNTTAESDGYVTGLEPGTNFPNPRSFEARQGRVVSLAPGQRRTFTVRLEAHATPEEVAQGEAAIQSLAAGRAPQIERQPQPSWCA